MSGSSANKFLFCEFLLNIWHNYFNDLVSLPLHLFSRFYLRVSQLFISECEWKIIFLFILDKSLEFFLSYTFESLYLICISNHQFLYFLSLVFIHFLFLVDAQKSLPRSIFSLFICFLIVLGLHKAWCVVFYHYIFVWLPSSNHYCVIFSSFSFVVFLCFLSAYTRIDLRRHFPSLSSNHLCISLVT